MNLNISILKVSAPIKPFPSFGDLWFFTQAEDGSLFTSWGDGFGPIDNVNQENNIYSHHGLARITGVFPDVQIEIVQRHMPFSEACYNSKPTSLLFLDGRLYASIHYPLCLPRRGIIAYSDDGGATFQLSPQTDRKIFDNGRFICLMFINMGRAYELNTDGFVYAFGTDAEVHQVSSNWPNAPTKEMVVYLVRMPRDAILDYSSWTYFGGCDANGEPRWSVNWYDSVPIEGLCDARPRESMEIDIPTLFSTIFHPGLGHYLALTATISQGQLYYAPRPWGPWISAGQWFEKEDSTAWYPCYMPALVPKDTGANTFYFVGAGQTNMWERKSDELDAHIVEAQLFRKYSNYYFRIGQITLTRT
jgi:hypothetical protein